MRTQKLVSSLILLGSCMILASFVWACTVVHVDSAAEITQKAEVIIRAQVVAYNKGEEFGGKVEFKVLEVLKGKLKQEKVAFPGQTENYYGPNDGKPPYASVRPGGRQGSCFAEDYKMNAEFLLFLRNDSPYWSPLAPTNEEVSGEDDPWVWWVKGYVSAMTKHPAPETK
jgi:hypothetical protein